MAWLGSGWSGRKGKGGGESKSVSVDAWLGGGAGVRRGMAGEALVPASASASASSSSSRRLEDFARVLGAGFTQHDAALGATQGSTTTRPHLPTQPPRSC